MAEITLTFPDGAKRTFPKGITGKELADFPNLKRLHDRVAAREGTKKALAAEGLS